MKWLAKNITLEELVRSQTAVRRGIDNTPPDEVKDNLAKLALALQVIRSYYDSPVIISSGYRCQGLNDIIGGSKNSHHMLGLAADFTVQGIANEIVMEDIQKLILFDQLIDEFGSWIHLSIHPKLRNEVFQIN